MKSCLVVDDSLVSRLVLRKILTQHKCDVSEAASGIEGLQICHQHGMPDVVLVDWQMPEMDGVAFVWELRRMLGGHRPLVVFCTTENDCAHIEMALQAGANEVIVKPLHREIVAAKLAEMGLIEG
jgi:two-component system chemotaxis response regulator CheY